MKTKERIIKLLRSTNREGIEKLLVWLNDGGFFESPASTKYHGCYKGGLAGHSLGVYELMCEHIQLPFAYLAAGQNRLPLNEGCLIIACLLHDVCKMGAYIGIEGHYSWNRKQPKGHGALSIKRISQFITLTDLETLLIKYHMGVYGLNEFYDEDDYRTGEYPLRGDHAACEGMTKEESKKARYGKSMANAWYHNPIVKVMYFCDELATLGEKVEANRK